MGSIRLGVDMERVIALRDRYHLTTFVETGTWKGGTCELVAAHFPRVITIEADRGWYERTSRLLGSDHPNISFRDGDSRVLLSQVLAEVDAPCLLWLDAHWNGGGAWQAHLMGDECPLREELSAVLASSFAPQHVILIDDARLFTAPPPYPHDPAQWMRYDEIRQMLAPRRLYVEDDVIYAEPVGEPEAHA